MSNRGNPYDLAELRNGLKPFRLHYFHRLRSTNVHAAQLRQRGQLFAPAVVLTATQTAGRGRGSNSWWSQRGSLTVTFVLPIDEHVQPHHLPLVAGLAARNAAAELTANPSIQLKWPNDLLFQLKKIGGLLCQRIMKADLIGIGLNVNIDPAVAPLDLRGRITSLAQIRGSPLDMTQTLLTLASHLRLTMRRAGEGPISPILREFDAHHALIGRQLCITPAVGEPPICGKCQGLDPIGRLLVRSQGQLHSLVTGQVQIEDN